MTIAVTIDSQATLAELISKVEAGEEVVIERDGRPIARISPIPPHRDAASVAAEIRAARKGYRQTSAEELIAWKNEGRRGYHDGD
jgi:antitoxin (DNA-binding transcriptional repressor) of toxin-antitoxin stability system